MDRNLPASRSETTLPETDEQTTLPRRQRISVAFLPLALATFIVLAFVMAAWTFLAVGA